MGRAVEGDAGQLGKMISGILAFEKHVNDWEGGN